MNSPKIEFPPLSRAESRKSVLEISGKVLNLNKNVFAAPPLRLSNQIDSSDVRPIRNGRFRFQTPVRRARIVRILAVKPPIRRLFSPDLGLVLNRVQSRQASEERWETGASFRRLRISFPAQSCKAEWRLVGCVTGHTSYLSWLSQATGASSRNLLMRQRNS